MPRLRELLGNSFTMLAYFVATIFATVRLLPVNHSYLNPGSIGQYGVRDVIAAAANNLTLRRENIDQIIVFLVILAGLAMLATYAVALVLYLLTSPAFAFSIVPNVDSYNLFTTHNPKEDLVFRMMDHTFGVQGVFGSQVMESGDAPNSFHRGLHALFGVYNSALLFFAIFIFLYHIVAVVYETTQSGTPFGQRFDKLWAPLRLIFALGILIPLASGLNAGQYMLLYIAKYGSGLASNSWIAYNNALENAGATNPLGSGGNDSVAKGNTRMYARPKIPDADRFIKHMILVSTCSVAYNTQWQVGKSISPYVINGDKAKRIALDSGVSKGITSYDKALSFSDYGNLRIRFGHKDKKNYGEQYPSGVYPHCGDVILPTPGQHSKETYNPGAKAISKSYFDNLIVYLRQTGAHRFAQRQAGQFLPNLHAICVQSRKQELLNSGPSKARECGAPGTGEIQTLIGEINTRLESVVEPGGPMDTALKTDKSDSIPKKLRDYGWGGAGIWYNRIAAKNGPIFDAAQSQPYVYDMPYIMQEVRAANAKKHPDSDRAKSYNPDLGGDYGFDDSSISSKKFATLFYQTNELLNSENAEATNTGRDSNVIFQAADFLFYTNGLFDVFDNRDVHPIAQLTGFGKSMVNSAIAQLYFATGLSFVSGTKFGPQTLEAASGFYTTMAGIAAILGMMLYYVIPFMPFLYFFFAIGKWIRSIAEAMVGLPLWALAHISIEGEGFPTQASENGYYLLLEIFLRPFIVVAALIGASIIFAAQAIILNDIFELVTRNIGGPDYVALMNSSGGKPASGKDTMSVAYLRPRLDQFFYTVMYVIILYIMANASFKLIDAVPQSILRWAGSSTQSFGDTAQDPLSNFQRNLAIGQMLVSSQVGGAVRQAGGAAGAGASSVAGGLTNRFGPSTGTVINRLPT